MIVPPPLFEEEPTVASQGLIFGTGDPDFDTLFSLPNSYFPPIFPNTNMEEVPADMTSYFPPMSNDFTLDTSLQADQPPILPLLDTSVGLLNQDLFTSLNSSAYPLQGLDASPYYQPYSSQNLEQQQSQTYVRPVCQPIIPSNSRRKNNANSVIESWNNRETSTESEETQTYTTHDNRKVSSNRAAKQRGDPSCDPAACYESELQTPHPWGSKTWYGHHLFSYTQKGQWLRDRHFDADQLREYVDNCSKDTIIWVQQAPTQCNHRLDDEDRKCRWADCPVPNKTIAAGWLRVAIDEHPHLTSNGTRDPLKCAGSMHLWCFEQIFDPVELHNSGILRPENRHFPLEDKSAVALDKLTDASIVREAYQPWFSENARQYNQFGPMLGMRTHEETLSYRLIKYHLDNQTDARRRARSKRNRNKCDEEKKTIDVHMGNLGLYAKITKKARTMKQTGRRRYTTANGKEADSSSIGASTSSSDNSKQCGGIRGSLRPRKSGSDPSSTSGVESSRTGRRQYNLRRKGANRNVTTSHRTLKTATNPKQTLYQNIGYFEDGRNKSEKSQPTKSQSKNAERGNRDYFNPLEAQLLEKLLSTTASASNLPGFEDSLTLEQQQLLLQGNQKVPDTMKNQGYHGHWSNTVPVASQGLYPNQYTCSYPCSYQYQSPVHATSHQPRSHWTPPHQSPSHMHGYGQSPALLRSTPVAVQQHPYDPRHAHNPVYGAPVYGALVYGSPVYEAPVYGAPVYEASVHGAPVHGAPNHEAPSHGGPKQGGPNHEPLVHHPTHIEKVSQSQPQRNDLQSQNQESPNNFVVASGDSGKGRDVTSQPTLTPKQDKSLVQEDIDIDSLIDPSLFGEPPESSQKDQPQSPTGITSDAILENMTFGEFWQASNPEASQIEDDGLWGNFDMNFTDELSTCNFQLDEDAAKTALSEEVKATAASCTESNVTSLLQDQTKHPETDPPTTNKRKRIESPEAADNTKRPRTDAEAEAEANRELYQQLIQLDC